MNFSKRGKTNSDVNSSRLDNTSNYSDSNNPNRGNQAGGRSPTNLNRKGDLEKSTLESGPEIQYIDNDIERRNPMMDYNDGRDTEKNFYNKNKSPNNRDSNQNNRNSVLTNVRNDVGKNNSIPANFDPDKEKRMRDDDVYSSNTRTLNQKRQNQPSETNSYASDTKRRAAGANPGNNGIIKKMSPNRNNEVNMDQQNKEDEEKKRRFVKKLSIISDKNNLAQQLGNIKPEYSVDTRENISKKYGGDLDKILKDEKFKKYSNNIVAHNPKEGRLYTNQTQQISPFTQKQLEEQKQAIKRMNKLSTILIKDKQTKDPKTSTVRNTQSEFQEKTLRKNANASASPGKHIRLTMGMLFSKGPNLEDRIITRQMRFEKGGVVDLAQNAVKNRSLPKKTEVKKTVLRSPKPTTSRTARINSNNKEKENAAVIVQGWWRNILSKYREVVDKTIRIQTAWRRYFVRKNLYDRLSYFYYYAFIMDKLENLVRKSNLVTGYNAIMNVDPRKYNALKLLKSTIFIQRAWRFYKKLKNENRLKPNKKTVRLPNRKGYEADTKPSNDRYPEDDGNKGLNKKDNKSGSNTKPDDKNDLNQSGKNGNRNNQDNDNPINGNKSTVNNRNGKRRGDVEDDDDPNSLSGNKSKENNRNGKRGGNIEDDDEETPLSGNKSTTKNKDGKRRGDVEDDDDQLAGAAASRRRDPKDDDEIDTKKNSKLAVNAELENKFNKLKNSNLYNGLRNIVDKSNSLNFLHHLYKWRNVAAIIPKNERIQKALAKNIDNITKNFSRRHLNKLLNGLKNKGQKPDMGKAITRLNNVFRNLSNKTKKDIFNNIKDKSGIAEKENEEKLKKILGANTKTLIKKIFLRKYANAFNKWMKNALIAPKEKDLNKLLQKLFNRTDLNYKFFNTAHFFNIWKNAKKNNKIDELRDKILKNNLFNFDKNRKKISLRKRFNFWKSKTIERNAANAVEAQGDDKAQKLAAVSKLIPAIANYSKKRIASLYKEPIKTILNQKNRAGKIKELIKLRPFFRKYDLKRYFDKFKNNGEKLVGQTYKNTIMKNLFKKYLSKPQNELMRKKLNAWWRKLPEANTESMKNINAVDALKKALQKRFCEHPINAFKEKIESSNYDWGARFIIEMKRKILKGSIREYIARWRNNYLEDMVNDNMKKFYAGILGKFCKRFSLKILGKKLRQWRENGLTGSKDNTATLVGSINKYMKKQSKPVKQEFIDGLKKEKKNRKYEVALGVITELYFNRDRKRLGDYFRKWNLRRLLGQLGELKGNLIGRILNKFIDNKEGLNKEIKLKNYFNRWKKRHQDRIENIKNFQDFLRRCLLSSLFHDRYVRGNLDGLLEFAEHYRALKKAKAMKIGDFITAILKIYRRIQHMKRQKALIEALKKLNFLERMTMISACKKWRNRSAIIANNDKASILQNFIRDVCATQDKANEAGKKALLTLDNFTKRFIFHKMSSTAKLNKINEILVKLFDKIPKELRKKYLVESCIRWNDEAQSRKKQAASEMITKHLIGWITRRFFYKLKLKKYRAEDLIRRKLADMVGLKNFYWSEWKRRAMMFKYKQDSEACGIWVSKKFDNFKKLKTQRILGELFNKYLKKSLLDVINQSLRIDPHRDQKLVNAINKVYLHPPAKDVLKELKRKFFKKKYGQIFGTIIRNLRFCHVYYYANQWRNKVMDLLNAKLVKLQSWVRMALKRIKVRRQLRKERLTLWFFLRVAKDSKLLMQGCINFWRNMAKFGEITDATNILGRIIRFQNAKTDFDSDVAQNNMKKIFGKYFVYKLKDNFIDCKKYKDSVLDALKNLGSKIEKRYAVNNLVDYGKDSIRRMMLEMVFGIGDKFNDKTKLRLAIDKWRFYNDKLLDFVLRIQKMWRGRKMREKLPKLIKVSDLLLRLFVNKLSDKDQKKARVIQWRTRAAHFAGTEKANIITKFLKDHMDGLSKKKIKDLVDKGYRNHQVKSIGQVAKFKKLKESIAKPINKESMDSIRRVSNMDKIKEKLRGLMGNFHEDNVKDYKKDILKKWRIKANNIKENEMFAALLIVASIKARLVKIKVNRFKALTLKMRLLLFKAFGDENGLKRCAAIQWQNANKNLALNEAKDTLQDHAVTVLEKIKGIKLDDKRKRNARAGDIIKRFLGKILLRSNFGLGLQNAKNNRLREMDDIYRNKYFDHIREGFKRISWWSVYKNNLIKKIQHRWRFYNKLQTLIRRATIVKNIVKYGANRELQMKHAYMLTWKHKINKLTEAKHGTVISDFYRKIIKLLNKQKKCSINNLKDLFKENILHTKILNPLKDFNKFQKLQNLDKMIIRGHLRFFNYKTLILYIMNLILGFWNKCEAKVKQSSVYKFRYIALKLRNKEAAGKIYNCIKELKNRRHDNKIRNILVRIAKGSEYDEKEILMKGMSDWCRNAEVLKIKEEVSTISNFLVKKKKALDLKKKWMRLGLRVAGKGGLYSAQLLLDRMNLFKNTEPFVRFINRRNIAKNGRDLLDRIRKKNALDLLKLSFKDLIDQKDNYSLILHSKHWNSQVSKLKKRDDLLDNAGNMLKDKFLERGFRTVIGALDFKRFTKYAQLIQKHFAITRMRNKAEGMKDVQGLANSLVKAQVYHFDHCSSTFRDKLYKFYVYKNLANMGAIFLKTRDRLYRKDFARKVLDSLLKKSNPSKFYMQQFVEKFKNLLTKRFDDFLNRLTVKKATQGILLPFNRMRKDFFDKLKKMKELAYAKANLFILLRRCYLQKKLDQFEGANPHLILNYIMGLCARTRANATNKKLASGFKHWKYLNTNEKIVEEKSKAIKEALDGFSSNITDNLLLGENGIISMLKGFQKKDADPKALKKLATRAGDKVLESKKSKVEELKKKTIENKASIRKPTFRKEGESLRDDDNDLYRTKSSQKNLNDSIDLRGTMGQAQKAKRNLSGKK